MGEVFHARDNRLHRDVAIKILPTEFASDPERRGRFEREAQAASALNHPNITTIYDIGEDAGTRYIAMELVEGQTLMFARRFEEAVEQFQTALITSPGKPVALLQLSEAYHLLGKYEEALEASKSFRSLIGDAESL